MFRKTILALTATGALAGAALIPTSASAYHGHGFSFHGFHGFHGFRGGFNIVVGGPVYSSCWRYRYVETRRGMRRMLVNVCY